MRSTPPLLGFTFVLTGFFIHQAHVAGAKGWSLDLIASAFVAYACLSVVTALSVGVLIDRVGAVRIMPLYPIPLAASMVVLALGEGGWGAFGYMGLAGMEAGATLSLSTAVWAELYGTRHLGSIRALVVALLVMGSALSPYLVGVSFDAGVSVTTIAWLACAYLIAAALVCAITLSVCRNRLPTYTD